MGVDDRTDDEKTDPGGHAKQSDELPDVVLTGKLTEDLQAVVNETRQLRRELRAHQKNDDLRWKQVVESDRARLNEHEERIEHLEEHVYAPDTEPPTPLQGNGAAHG